MRIATELYDFARREGKVSGLRKAEGWRDALDEMVEVADKRERKAITILLKSVNDYVKEENMT